jgi:phosphohistidine phosphatase
MELYLIRHAIAEDRDATRWPDDSARPLTAAGAERFARAVHGLRRLVPAVETVLSSPYERAWQTAEILRDEAGWPPPEPCDALGAHHASRAALEVLQERRVGSIALVGHEPYLSSLASLLLAGTPERVDTELKKGGAIGLRYDGDPVPGRAILLWSASPRILRGLARGTG